MRLRLAPVPALLAIALLLAAPPPAAAEPASGREGAGWLDRLQDDVARDLAAGRPLVVQVHVPLCESSIIRCGNARLGDGDAPATNLYWSTSGGFRWFDRRGSGWRRVHVAGGGGNLLETRVWRRTLAPAAAWRARGVKQPITVY